MTKKVIRKVIKEYDSESESERTSVPKKVVKKSEVRAERKAVRKTYKKNNAKPNIPYGGKTTEWTETNLISNGIPLLQRYVTPLGGKKTMTRKEALTIATGHALKLKEDADASNMDIKLSVCTLDSKFGWRRGYERDSSENVQLWSRELYDVLVNGDEFEEAPQHDQFEALSFYVRFVPKGFGNNDKYNDCVYDSLSSCIKLPWSTPDAMKKYLKVNRFDKVRIGHIPLIEEKLKDAKINVSGDATYFSPRNDVKYTISLMFKDGHCTVDNPHLDSFFIPTNDKDLYVYHQIDKGEYLVYRGPNREAEKKSFSEIMTKLSKQVKPAGNKSNNMYVQTKEKDIVKAYHEIIEGAKLMRQKTNGLVNMFKTGSYKRTCLKLFYDTIPHIVPDNINRDEAEWIRLSTIGPVLYCEPGYEGEIHYADFKSFYPDLLQRAQAKYPMKRGEFKSITNDEFKDMEFYQFGIYHVLFDGESCHKLFKFNCNNYYTHCDLELAKKLKLTFNIIEDGQANILHYSADKLVTGHMLFHKFVSTLYPLRKKTPNAKVLLNLLWGSLGEINKEQKRINLNVEYEIPKNAFIEYLKPNADGTLELAFTEREKPIFKTQFARIVPFLIAYGRRDMITLIEPFVDDVVYARTDGFRTKTYQKLTYGEELGDLKYEGVQNIHIHNINHVEII